MPIAIIPARGGSKRIPRKNLKPFASKPMLGYAIDAALESGCFDRVLVSTEDEEIAACAESLGAQVPFRRPAELADDFTGTTPVVVDAIRQLEALGVAADPVCCIYATVPLLRASDLREAFRWLQRPGVQFVFSMTEYASPIQRAYRQDEEGRMQPFWPEMMPKRSQDLEPAFHDAGQFYWGTRAAWLGEPEARAAGRLGFPLPRWRVADIDTEDDWRFAELLRETLDRLDADRSSE